MADGVTGVGKGVWVTGRVAVRKGGPDVGSLDDSETLQAVNAISKSEQARTYVRIPLL